MLIWYYGSTMIIGARVTMRDGTTPQGGATVTCELLDKQGNQVFEVELEELPEEEGTYEAEVNPEDVFGENFAELDDDAARRMLYRANVIAELPSGARRQARPKVSLLYDMD